MVYVAKVTCVNVHVRARCIIRTQSQSQSVMARLFCVSCLMVNQMWLCLQVSGQGQSLHTVLHVHKNICHQLSLAGTLGFYLNGVAYPNGSTVLRTDIGEGDDALQCTTDSTTCCSNISPEMHSGQFYFPITILQYPYREQLLVVITEIETHSWFVSIVS